MGGTCLGCSPLKAGVFLKQRCLQLVGLRFGRAKLLQTNQIRVPPEKLVAAPTNNWALTSCRRLFSSAVRRLVAASFS